MVPSAAPAPAATAPADESIDFANGPPTAVPPANPADVATAADAAPTTADVDVVDSTSIIDTCDATLPALRICIHTPSAPSSNPPALQPPPSIGVADLDHLRSHCAHLESLLGQRDTAIHLHERDIALHQREQAALRTALEAARRQSDDSVMRYATTEKTLLDLRRTVDAAAKRAAADAKTTAALHARVAFLTGERDRAQRDHRKAATETEALRHELFALETRLKGTQAKLRAEAVARTEADQRTAAADRQRSAELLAQQQQRNGEREADAQLILLRHTLDAKERECGGLQARCAQLAADAERLAAELAAGRADRDSAGAENAAHQAALLAAAAAAEQQANGLVNAHAQLTEARAHARALQERLAVADKALLELDGVRALYAEQQLDVQRMREQDDELRSFVRLLTEKAVRVENELILCRARATALDVGAEHARLAGEESRRRAVELELELATVQAAAGREREVAAAAVRRAQEERDRMRAGWESGLGELEVCRRKHGQVVKELQRDLGALRQQQAEAGRLARGEAVAAEQQQQPSRKSLIDRIAKLQRILARQTEKIEFLENHSAGLVNQLKVLQAAGAGGGVVNE